MLEIKNLKAEINNKKIIKGLNLKINQGVPQEVLDESKAKMRAVNSAWSQIQKLKN
jgi:Fe-S cluster assembly ATPase SufC